MRSDLTMAVVHIGRAMAALSRSGYSTSTPEFVAATQAIAKASNLLIDAIDIDAIEEQDE